MKKLFILLITSCLFLVGCTPSDDDESEEDKEARYEEQRQACCLDNNGRWNGTSCLDFDEDGNKISNYSLDGYIGCIEEIKD